MQGRAARVRRGALPPVPGDPRLDDVEAEGLRVAHLLQVPAVLRQRVGDHLLVVGEGAPGVALPADHLLGGRGFNSS